MDKLRVTNYTDVHQGLSQDEVATRVKQRQTNKVKQVVGKSYLQIFATKLHLSASNK